MPNLFGREGNFVRDFKDLKDFKVLKGRSSPAVVPLPEMSPFLSVSAVGFGVSAVLNYLCGYG